MKPRCVLDTNVLVAALRSSRGASFELLRRVPLGYFTLSVSVPLVMEYAEVLARPGLVPVTGAAVAAVLDMVCAHSDPQPIHFLWRPQLTDPNDEMVLEAAVNSGAAFLVTHYVGDFTPASRFGVKVVTPAQFLLHLEGDKP